MATEQEKEFIKELNKLVAKYGLAIESEYDSHILELEGEEGSKVFFSRFDGKYHIVKG